MNKRLITIFLLMMRLLSGAGEPVFEKPVDMLSFRQLEAGNPWLKSNNAAGLSQMEELFPTEIKFGLMLDEGDFYSVFKGKSDQSADFDSRSFRRINKTYLYGSFNYRRSLESGLNFSNTNDPAANYPYLLTDTIGNDTYHREFFKLAGIISSPLATCLDWGLSFDYEVGVASQNRDPRPENKVVQTNISPGLLYKAGRFKLGANLLYGYYNEDIDVSVVEENVQHAMFQVHGPGVFNYHVSSSFYRLYQQQRLGGGTQFGWATGHVSNLLHSNCSYSFQTIDDGRGAGTATWAVKKSDAVLEGIDWDLTDVFLIDRGDKIQQLTAMLRINSKLGTEFIQRLEKVGETDLEHWITYGKEQKYYSIKTNAGLNYQVIRKDDHNMMKSLLVAGLNYSSFAEKYYLPDNDQHFSNIRLDASYLKLFKFPRANFSSEMRLGYQFNLDSQQNLKKTNFMVQKIFVPEFNYLTEGFVLSGISLGYQVPLKKIFNKYFIKKDFDWLHSADGRNRTMFSFSTGVIF